MSKNTHVNVTIDFRNWEAGIYDLRIPAHQSVNSLLLNLMDTLQMQPSDGSRFAIKENENHQKVEFAMYPIQPSDGSRFAIKVATKNLLLSDDDILLHYPVADGDL